MKRGPHIADLDWQLVSWSYSNQSLATLLNVTPDTVARMRTLHSPETCRGPGRAPEGRHRSGAIASPDTLDTARTCRRLAFELATGQHDPATVAHLRQLLDKLEGAALHRGGDGSR